MQNFIEKPTSKLKKAWESKKAKETWTEDTDRRTMPTYKRKCIKTTVRKPTGLWKNWQARNTGSHYHPGPSREISQRRTRHSKEVDRVLSEFYTHTTTGDPKLLDVPPPTNNDGYPILREEVEAAVKSLKKDKSAGVDNIPSELVQAGGEAMIDMLLIICNKIWQTGEWPTPWTQSLIITLPKKGNLQLCPNYRTISLISQPSKVMLRILLNRLKPQAEEIIKEEQAGFRAGGAQLGQFSILEYSVRNTCNTSKAFAMSLWTSRRRSTESGMQLCVQPYGCITPMTTWSEA